MTVVNKNISSLACDWVRVTVICEKLYAIRRERYNGYKGLAFFAVGYLESTGFSRVCSCERVFLSFPCESKIL